MQTIEQQASQLVLDLVIRERWGGKLEIRYVTILPGGYINATIWDIIYECPIGWGTVILDDRGEASSVRIAGVFGTNCAVTRYL